MPTALASPCPNGGRLDAERRLVLRVAGRAAAELPEIFDLLEPERITGKVEKRIKQHRAMTIRENEAVAVEPERIAGVVLEEIAPQGLCYVGHSHGHARMA